MEKKLNDAVIRIREHENKELENIRIVKHASSELESKDREISYLQDKINKLSDPVTIKYEKDGLVQTYKKRV